MASSRVLRLRRTDLQGEHLLVHVSQAGPKSLDLRLIASEGVHVYPANLKEDGVRSLRAGNHDSDLHEWKTVLKAVLLQQRPDGPMPESLQGLETIAAISGSTLTITMRKNISGIHQRLGSIKLEQNDEEEVDPFAWASSAVASADALRHQLETLQISVMTQQEQVAKLTKHLDDLVRAKSAHEDELLKKFAALLNAKKLKIRDQQRLLARAKVDPEVAEAVSDLRRGSPSRSVKTSSKGKRKAEDAAESGENDSAAEDDEVDAGPVETPQGSDADFTEDDEDGAEGSDPVPAASQKAGQRPGCNAADGEASNVTVSNGDDPPPPKRELPFVKRPTERKEAKNSESAAEHAVLQEDGDGDDETDDEL